MRVYGICWVTAVGALAAVCGVSAAVTSGWVGIVVTGVCSTVLAAMVGVVWAEESDEPVRRTVLRCGAWGVAGGLLVVGLPSLLGVWSLVALLALVVTAPPLVVRALEVVHDHRVARPEATGEPAEQMPPEAPSAEPLLVDVSLLTDRELERRWHVTSARMRHPGTTADAAMALAGERVLLLDEIERRNPVHFAAIVDRAIGLSDDREGGSSG